MRWSFALSMACFSCNGEDQQGEEGEEDEKKIGKSCGGRREEGQCFYCSLISGGGDGGREGGREG